MKKNIMSVIIAMALALSLTACAGSVADMSGSTVPAYVPVGIGAAGSDGAAAVDAAAEPVSEAAEPVQESAGPDVVDAMPAVAEPVGTEPDDRTADEKLIDDILEACSTKAIVETDFSACVVDVRTARNPYDVYWDYGPLYTNMAYSFNPAWDYVFDAEYYKSAFPALALLYHGDDALLKQHFITVGIHEGRQGNASFNVKTFMDGCSSELRGAFGDNYECYYLYWLYSAEVDRNADMSAHGNPQQMTAIMTAVQKEEFDAINAERERKGSQPVEFDSELAAIANYRAWINADENWDAHDWAIQNNDALWDVIGLVKGDTLSENTTSRFREEYNNWARGYISSTAHRNAMVDTRFNFTGNSNVYACDNTLPQYAAAWRSDTRYIHFDVFMGTLDTALHNN